MDSIIMEYAQARNLTLLFFAKYIIEKGEPRTLKDLSCQLHAHKGFTKEMRQIVGRSQAGLKNFLAQYPGLYNVVENHHQPPTADINDFLIRYPAIFSEDGDCLDKNSFQKYMFGSDASSNNDYMEEAKKYYSDKMVQFYGEGTEVSIKSLLGHCTQASSPVRYVSGQRIEEFKDFLLKHPDVFHIINGNSVVLVSNLPATDTEDTRQLIGEQIRPWWKYFLCCCCIPNM